MRRSPEDRPTSPRNNIVDVTTLQLAATRLRPINSLKGYARSLRKHPENQLVKLAACIREYGFLNPVLIDEDGVIIAGAARVEAAKRAGLAEVPVIEISHLSAAQVRAFRIADNKLGELSVFDREALALEINEILSLDDLSVEALGFETAEVDLLLQPPPEADEEAADPADDVPELPAQPVSRSGDLWQLGSHRLLCGSSLEEANWIRLMAGQTGAVVFTDAPFNVKVQGHVSGLGKAKHAEFAMASGEMSEAEFIAFNQTYLTRLAEHICDGAILYACMDWRHLYEIQSGARAAGLSLINLCVWAKTNGGMGSFYRSQTEMVLVLKKGRASHINNVQLGATGRYRTNLWRYAGANSFGTSRDADLADHPTVKPIALVADAIRDASNVGQIVLDAFMGSGTTILAAERTKRRAYGIEIAPGYIDVAIRRWSTMTGEMAILEGTGETFEEVRARRNAEAAVPPESSPPPASAPIAARSRQRRAA